MLREMPLLVLLKVTDCVPLVVPTPWLANVSEDGETLTVGMAEAPVPLRLTVCEPVDVLVFSVSVALRVPDAEGVKVTFTAQEPPTARLVPQVLVWANSEALLPLRVMLLTVSVTLPVLLRVAGCEPLVVPTVWLAKVSDDGVRLSVG